MKHAGSVRLPPCAFHQKVFALFLLLSLTSLSLSFSPPRIIYGGWTPILPGHPFYFGPTRRKHYEQASIQTQLQYAQHTPQTIGHFHSPVIKTVGYHPEEQQIAFIEPQKYENSPEVYQQHHAHYTKSQNVALENSPGVKKSKNIFAYYPPQSAFEGPKHDNLDYKPVYLEVPRKPFDVYENPHHDVPYILPSHKDIPFNNININQHSLSGMKAFLELTPLGKVNPRLVKHVGDINLDKVHVFPNLLNKPEFPAIKDSSGGSPLRPKNLLHSPLPPMKQHSLLTEPKFEIRNQNFLDSGLGPVVPHNIHGQNEKGHQVYFDKYTTLPRSQESPIGSSKFKNAHLINYPSIHDSGYENKASIKPYLKNTDFEGQNYPSGVSNNAHIPVVQEYEPNHELLTSVKYLPNETPLGGQFRVAKNLYSTHKNIANQMKKFVGPKFEHYNPMQSFYTLGGPKVFLRSVGSPFSHLSKVPSGMSLKKPYRPKLLSNYVNKNTKLGGYYKGPGVLANIHGTPAIVEREVAIIHVPVNSAPGYSKNLQHSSDEKEFLHFTASTPGTTQTGSSQTFIEGRYVPHNGTSDESHFYVQDVRNIDESDLSESSNLDDTESNLRGSSNNLNGRNHPNEFEYIFVGTDGMYSKDLENSKSVSFDDFHSDDSSSSRTPELKKHFFHAYYATSDHTPPKGYVRMSVAEFRKLFKNAEIRYLDKEPPNFIKFAAQKLRK